MVTRKPYLGGHELGCSTESRCGGTIPHVFLAETIICDLDVTIKGQEDVVQFQITVNDTMLVEVLQCQTDLGSVELRSLQSELTTLDVKHEITAGDILHDKVDPCLGLETGVQVEEERMALLVGNEEHSFLRLGRLDLIILDDEFLLQHFDSIQLFRRFGLGEHNFTEIALSEHSQKIKMIQANASA